VISTTLNDDNWLTSLSLKQSPLMKVFGLLKAPSSPANGMTKSNEVHSLHAEMDGK
jgi:hypothetical protein